MLSAQSVNTLRDLLENRLSMMDITDREDLREATIMKRALNELMRVGGQAIEAGDFADLLPRRGRKKKILMDA
ncbi:MAG: hypothetical protein AB7G06_04545 [Bdellovibrionales bacterium]